MGMTLEEKKGFYYSEAFIREFLFDAYHGNQNDSIDFYLKSLAIMEYFSIQRRDDYLQQRAKKVLKDIARVEAELGLKSIADLFIFKRKDAPKNVVPIEQ